jgi:GT2 family glycosyltransferase
LSILTNPARRPVEVVAAPTASATARPHFPGATMRICVLVVTWNRKPHVTTILQSLARQTYPIDLLDVIVVDNAGTDGTLDHLRDTFQPDRIVDNDTEKAHEPHFQPARTRDWASDSRNAGANTLGFASLSIVRNRANMGGCGGFNTGLAFVEHAFDKSGGAGGAPEFVWLVDDDADLPPDALANLVCTMASDPRIGIVGSRTCDITDRTRTIETTIYFNSETGSMQDDAPPGHPRADVHKQWLAVVGGPRGQGGEGGVNYRGTMDVDVVSAASMLARWKAVVGEKTGDKTSKRGIGFWDHRYFIYCDDADWCLRFAKAGWRVVLSLDAVVYHMPWNLKLTPARIYYANRNRLWMVQKTLPADKLREVTGRIMRTFLFDSMHAALHRRQFHARIILQTGLDAANNVGGKTGSDGPPAIPTIDALRQAGCLRRGSPVAVVCNAPESLEWLADLQARTAAALKPGEKAPRWVPIVRNDIKSPPANSIIYGQRLRSRLKKQLWILARRPRAVVVFNQVNDFPVLFCAPWTIHIDSRKLEAAQIERDGWIPRLGFLGRWISTRRRLKAYARTVAPFESQSRYG